MSLKLLMTGINVFGGKLKFLYCLLSYSLHNFKQTFVFNSVLLFFTCIQSNIKILNTCFSQKKQNKKKHKFVYGEGRTLIGQSN